MKEEKKQSIEQSEKVYESPKIEEHRILDKASECGLYVRSYNSDTGIYWF